MSQQYPANSGFIGSQNYHSDNSRFNATQFHIEQVLSKLGTSMPVKVLAVTNTGGVSPTGTVDVQPLVNQIDGDGNQTPHGVLHGLPYVRLYGGANAIIIDPQVGDIGVAVFAQRDISAVKKTKKQANPGSRRQYSMADGMYFGGTLSGTPTQYIQFQGSTIAINGLATIVLTAPETKVDGNLTVSTGATGSFTTLDGHTVTVKAGIITNIY